MDLEDVKLSLQENQTLTEEVKENIFELVVIFQKQYPNIPLDLLVERLKSLKVESVSKFVSKKPLIYNDKTNTIQIHITSLSEASKVDHLFMVAILHMISLNDKDPKEILHVFRDGYANIIANNLVGSVDYE